MQWLASLGARERVRTPVAQDGAVWIWPGILLTLRRGGETVPVAGETIRFWITRLHGPEALYKDLLSEIARAARFLTNGAEAKASQPDTARYARPWMRERIIAAAGCAAIIELHRREARDHH